MFFAICFEIYMVMTLACACFLMAACLASFLTLKLEAPIPPEVFQNF
jgi:hypothetical protein